MANIRKRKGKFENSYLVQIRLKGHKPVSATFNRLSEANHWAEDTEEFIRAGGTVGLNKIDDADFTSALDKYISTVSKLKAYSTYQRDLMSSNRLIEFFKPYSLKEITPALVAQYRDKRLETVSPSTLKKELAVLSHMYTIARTEWALDVSNPVQHIRKPTLPRGRLRLLDPEEIEKLLSAAQKSKNPFLLSYIRLQLYTAMRPSEGAGLIWKQVLFNHNIIDLSKTKTDPRRVPLLNTAVNLLQKLQPSDYSPEDYVFLPKKTSRHAQLRPNLYFRRAFINAINRAKITDFTMHDMRHTTASYLVMNDVDIRTIADILGHKTMDMVMRYTHLLDKYKIEAVEKLDGLF